MPEREIESSSGRIQDHLGRQDDAIAKQNLAIERLTIAIIGDGSNGLMSRVQTIEWKQKQYEQAAHDQHAERAKNLRTILTLIITQIIAGGAAVAIWILKQMLSHP
jgi:hypothetical protein